MTDQTELRIAYTACLRLARGHYENFPVASRLLPSSIRPHIAAVYAFARVADDFADEGDCAVQERLSLLDRWESCLVQPEDGLATNQSFGDLTQPEVTQIFVALRHTIDKFALPIELFTDLLSAFRQDVTVKRYENWVDLLDYCRRSANPIGRIVLRLAGHTDPVLDRQSDCVCSALQITNFLQDFGRDWKDGRLYVPFEIQDECGAKLADLEANLITSEWREALERCAEKTKELFLEGRPVCDGVTGALRMELRLTWLGGMRILDRVGRRRYDPLNKRPVLGVTDFVPLVWRAVVWT
jgi:phytoene synthase